uniref:Uncharacterized protein n=1 Tax=Schizaphis graminum TaxID=13262 RepID=A0A2S2P081_SCHGA
MCQPRARLLVAVRAHIPTETQQKFVLARIFMLSSPPDDKRFPFHRYFRACERCYTFLYDNRITVCPCSRDAPHLVIGRKRIPNVCECVYRLCDYAIMRVCTL